MRTRFCFGLLAALLFVQSASAQIYIDFNAWGSATKTQFSSVGVIPCLGNIVDPVDPTNGLMPLAFDLSSVAALPLVTGDIELTNPFNPTITHDLLRFVPGDKLLVYSDLPAYAPTDVGIPTYRQSNLLSMPVGPFGLYQFAPTYSVQPGAQTFAFFGNGLVYTYTPSVPPVPEPAALSLLMWAGAMFIRRRRG